MQHHSYGAEIPESRLCEFQERGDLVCPTMKRTRTTTKVGLSEFTSCGDVFPSSRQPRRLSSILGGGSLSSGLKGGVLGHAGRSRAGIMSLGSQVKGREHEGGLGVMKQDETCHRSVLPLWA